MISVSASVLQADSTLVSALNNYYSSEATSLLKLFTQFDLTREIVVSILGQLVLTKQRKMRPY